MSTQKNIKKMKNGTWAKLKVKIHTRRVIYSVTSV